MPVIIHHRIVSSVLQAVASALRLKKRPQLDKTGLYVMKTIYVNRSILANLLKT